MSGLDRTRVREALELVDYSSGDGRCYDGATRDRRLDLLIEHFINEFPASPAELRIATSTIEEEIRDILSEAADNSSPVDEFVSRFNDLPAIIGSRKMRSFSLGFPINISAWPLGDEIIHRNRSFQQIDRELWMERYGKPALDDSRFRAQFNAMPNEFKEEFTYWEAECPARDPRYAIEVTEGDLEVVLGQIIYAIFPWGHSTQFSQGNVWNRPWSELRPPFVYILSDDRGYYDYYFDDDISPREVIQMFIDRNERLKYRYQQIPPLNDQTHVEQKLVTAFRNFHSGATEPDRRRAFLDYWRAIESLCLFGDESMTTVVTRIKSVVPYENGDTLFESRLDMLKDKRNSYVHEQVDVEITRRDNEFLRQMFYELLPFFCINRNSSKAKLQVWLDNGYKSIDQLNDNIQRKASEITVLEAIRNSKGR